MIFHSAVNFYFLLSEEHQIKMGNLAGTGYKEHFDDTNATYIFVTCFLKVCKKNRIYDKDSTCSGIVFGAVPIIDIFLSDIKLWQSNGIHLHWVSCLPHELQVVRSVANLRKEVQRHTKSQNT